MFLDKIYFYSENIPLNLIRTDGLLWLCILCLFHWSSIGSKPIILTVFTCCCFKENNLPANRSGSFECTWNNLFPFINHEFWFKAHARLHRTGASWICIKIPADMTGNLTRHFKMFYTNNFSIQITSLKDCFRCVTSLNVIEENWVYVPWFTFVWLIS